jgi:catechol 2,3-dioxygenase-like lactoylglutathione lyase family enzyme
VVEGVSKVVIDVDDQARALVFWTETLGFELHRDSTYGGSAGSRSERRTED